MRPFIATRLLCLSAVIAAALVAGCASVQPTPTPEPVTLRYACTDADNPRYGQLLEEFRQRHPYITVEMAGEQFETADVVMAPILNVSEMIENKHVIALDPYIEGNARFAPDEFIPGSVEMLRHEGRLWGLPATADPLVLFYSKDLFDAAGVPYPEPGWTWDEFLVKAAALTNARGGVYGYTMVDGALDLIAFMYQHGGGLMDSLTNPTRPTFNDPRNAEALDWWLALGLRHRVAPTPDELERSGPSGSPQALVYANKAAMWMGWFGERGGSATATSSSPWPAPWKMRWGVATVPRDARSTTLAMVSGYFISAQSANPDAAWKWIAFLSERAAHRGAPARLELLSSKQYESLAGKEVAELVRGVLEHAQLISPRIVAYGQAFDALGRQLQQVLRGDITAQEALDATQKVAEQAQP
ncbi:MAG: sugar ABC transporter substrate-binding protein [Chloroflexota bacterium]